MLLFRVETMYGVHDAYSLREAKATSKPSDHIQAATPSWAIRICEKFGFDCKI